MLVPFCLEASGLPILAAVDAGALDLDRFCNTVTNMFSRIDALAQPGHFVPLLSELSLVWAVLFLAAGTTCLLNGSRNYHAWVVGLLFLIGMCTGYWFASRVDAPAVLIGLCVGVMLAMAAFPLMKYAVALLGGLSGAFLGANGWTAAAHVIHASDAQLASEMAAAHWVGGLIGLVFCGMLAFVLFKLSLVMLTAVSGSTLAVIGGLALLLNVSFLSPDLSDVLTRHHSVLPMLVLVPAVLGLIFQEQSPRGGKAAASG